MAIRLGQLVADGKYRNKRLPEEHLNGIHWYL